MWSLLEAASFFDFQLPEVFAGFSQAPTRHIPIVYPTASKPQAWAAGTIVLLLRLVVGVVVQAGRRRPSTGADFSWPAGVPSSALLAFGMKALGSAWTSAS